jgi:hypothetical protein
MWIGIHLAGAPRGRLKATIEDMKEQFGVGRAKILGTWRKYRESKIDNN